MKRYILLFLFALSVNMVFAQKRNALVIGIDTYIPPAKTTIAGARKIFNDLDGCKNDAMSMKSLIQNKFGFNKADVDSLYNRDATRAQILAKLDALLKRSAAGDIAFIYYAGHGSQQNNSLTAEDDKMDESIVPSDTWKPGVGDIRDKELAKIFNEFLDKGVKLTVILDCCHSGSMSRGNTPEYDKPKTRYIAKNDFDAADASNPPAPEMKTGDNFLIISAAQDDELAEETKDERGKPHGAFTVALTEALNQQSVNASAINIFKAIGVILKNNGKKQEPVLGGSVSRQNQTLFGISRGALADKTLIPVSTIAAGKIELQGGYAEGLYKGHQLTLSTDTTVKLVIDSVRGISLSTAKLLKGTLAKVKVGQLFEVTNWISSGAPLLKVYLPETPFSASDMQKYAAMAVKLREGKGSQFVNDYQKTDPDATAYFVGDKLFYKDNSGTEQNIAPDAAALVKASGDKKLYFNVPSSKELNAALKRIFAKNSSIKIVSNASEAQYILYGTIDTAGKPAYGLLRKQAVSKDSLESMPVQTKFFALQDLNQESYDAAATEIHDLAKKLAKVRAWLSLSAPEDDENKFPFSLQIFNETTKKAIEADEYKIGDRISIRLQADSGYTESLNTPTPKFVYVFALDRNGAMTLVYPSANTGSLESKFPKDNTTTNIKLGGTFRVSEPVGTDNYFLITTETPIPGYAQLFNQTGTRGRNAPANGPKTPLTNLLNLGNDGGIGNGTRGPILETPANWGLQRKQMKSKH